MLRFPTPEDRGEGVITEVLGPRGQPGVDTLSVIRAFDLPDEFPEDALAGGPRQARRVPRERPRRPRGLHRRLVVTIDPADARDFDDAVSRDASTRKASTGMLDVHIADVAHFAPPGGPLDREARKRGTSVYLPQRVIPMFPEMISNGLASLQQGKAALRQERRHRLHAERAEDGTSRFANGAIRVRKRFTYEQVLGTLGQSADGPASASLAASTPEVLRPALRMRDLALILRKRRHQARRAGTEHAGDGAGVRRRGPGHRRPLREHDVSHQIIEEFMLAANEAVAEHLDAHWSMPFLRRVHPAPTEDKLKAFADFARSLGYKMQARRRTASPCSAS